MFGVFAVSVLHHVQEAIAKRGYDPGVVTCLPYPFVSALLLKAVWEAARQDRQPYATLAPA